MSRYALSICHIRLLRVLGALVERAIVLFRPYKTSSKYRFPFDYFEMFIYLYRFYVGQRRIENDAKPSGDWPYEQMEQNALFSSRKTETGSVPSGHGETQIVSCPPFLFFPPSYLIFGFELIFYIR